MKLGLHILLVALGANLIACGSSDDGSEPEEAKKPNVDLDPKTGFPYCAENPADRPVGEACVDEFGAVLCKADSGFPGDELAMCDPGDRGILLHYGPKDYNDPDEVARYTLGPGEEWEDCIFVHSPNQAEAFVRDFHGRMRPGSHHLIVTTLEQDRPDSEAPESCTQAEAAGTRWLLGSQDPQIDIDGTGSGSEPQPGDPDNNLAQKLAGNQAIRINMHYINTTDQPVLREAWVTLDYAPEDEVDDLVDMITFFQGNINVPPYSSSETAKAVCRAPTDRYVGLVTGHFHENGTRFSVWKRDQAGDDMLVYETYDWESPGNLYYSNRDENPVPNSENGTHGGHSGYLHLKAGESIVFQCAFDNPTDKTIQLGSRGKDQMCNVFGMYYPTDGDVWSCMCWGGACF